MSEAQPINRPERSGWEAGNVRKPLSGRSVCAAEQCGETQHPQTTTAQRANDPAWLRAQCEQLVRWQADNPQRWPVQRVIRAVLAIFRGDVNWCEAGCGDEGEVDRG